MELDLSPERYGSKAQSNDSYTSAEEIMYEADRITQVKKDAKIIADEIIKELDKREKEKEESVTVVEIQKTEPASTTNPIIFAGGGFLIGMLFAVLLCSLKIKQIRKECETKVNEAKDSLDRVVKMVTEK